MLKWMLVLLSFMPLLGSNAVLADPVAAVFDPTVKKLTPGFGGTSIIAMYNRLVPLPKRGEFETEYKYKARLPKPIEIRAAYKFDAGTMVVSYDADAEAFQLRYESDGITDGDNDNQPGFCPKTLSRSRQYRGGNAFGRHVTVTEFTRRRYCFRGEDQGIPVDLIVPMPAQIAKGRKSHLAVLALVTARGPEGQLAEGDTPGTGTYYSGVPTIDEPREETVTYYTHLVDFKGWLVFDDKTGEILGRYEPGGSPMLNDQQILAEAAANSAAAALRKKAEEPLPPIPAIHTPPENLSAKAPPIVSSPPKRAPACAGDACQSYGLCSWVNEKCGAGSDLDCKQSKDCRLAGRCRAVEGRCR